MSRLIAFFLLLFCTVPCLAAAVTVPAETLFVRSVEAYKAGQFQRARAGFREILDRHARRPVASASALMLGKTLYKLKEYDRAISAAIVVKQRFPATRYLPDVEYLIGNCYYRMGHLFDAASQYATSLSIRGGDLRLRRKVLELIGGMTIKTLSKHDLDLLKKRFGNGRISEAVTLGKAFYLLQWGNTGEGIPLIQDFIKRYPGSPLKPDALAALERKPSPPSAVEVVAQSKPSLLKIGLLCPLTGDDRGFGDELKRGAQIVLNQSGQEKALSLVVEDVGSGSVNAVKAAQKLVEQDHVVALVGPISSGPTIGVAAVANCARVPLIAPTASEDGIASIGPYVFQLNPTPGIHGKRIGEYAAGSLAMRTFALIASLDSYGKSMADSFTAAVERSGGKVIRREWYVPGTTTDFTKQLLRIREAILAQPSQLEVSTTPPSSMLLTSNDTTDTVSLDGLLVAGSPDDIVVIAPQVVFHKIKTQFLGGNGWNSVEVVRRGGVAVEGAVFTAEYIEGREAPNFQKFSSDFRAMFQKEPGMVATLGYDAMTLLVSAVKTGSRTPDEIRDYLTGISNFAGQSGTITLSGSRVNSNAYILKIVDGRIIQVQ